MTINTDNLPTDLKIDGDAETREVYINGNSLSPTASQKLRNHSPDGFNWGYGGSGPAQLALAILLVYMVAEEALSIYQDFKFKVVAGWAGGQDFEVRLNLKETINDILLSKQNKQ